MQELSSSMASSGNWRSQISSGTRQRIVNKIMDTLKKYLPIANTEDSEELRNIAIRFEEKIYTDAIDQMDYLRKISMKMLSMETKAQQSAPINPAIPNAGAGNQSLADPGSLGIQLQIKNPGQPLAVSNLSVLPQNHQSNSSASLEGSSGVALALASISELSQSNKSGVTQASILHKMTGTSQSSVNYAIGKVTQTEIYAEEQKQMQGSQKQQQQSQNPLISQHQIHQQFLNRKNHSSLLRQQQQQSEGQTKQSLLPPNLLESSQMQIPPNLQSNQSKNQQAQGTSAQLDPQTGCQQNHLNQIQQSVARQWHSHPSHQQEPSFQQQSKSISQNSTLSQQQRIMDQQRNMPNNAADIQQKHHRLPVQQNCLSSMQQSKQMIQQSLALEPQQQHLLSSQTNMLGLQQPQQVLGPSPRISNMQPHQRAMLMQKSAEQQQQQKQQTPHLSLTLLQSQVQQSPHQSSHQQLMSRFQPRPSQLQQQSSSLQRETHQRLQGSGPLIHVQNTTEQKSLIQTHKGLAEVSSNTSVDSTAQPGNAGAIDWQEECYQKVKSMREQYYTELLELYKRIALKFQQHEALIPQGKQTEQHEKLKNFKITLEHRLALMRVSKHDISVGLKEKLPIYERQIVNFITSYQRQIVNHSSQVQGQRQFQHSNVGNAHLIPEQQQSQSSQMPQGSGALSQMPSTSNVQHVSRPLSTEHQNILNILQPVSNSNAAQGSSFNSKNAIGSELMQQQQRHSLLQKRQPLQQDLHQQQKQQSQLPIPHFWQLHSMNELRQLKAKQGSDIKSRLNEYSAGQHHSYYYNQLKPRASYPVSSPPILPPLSPQISNHSSPHIDQNGQLSSIPKVKGSTLSANSPLSVTPSTPFAPSPTPVDSEKQQSAISSAAHQQTPASPLRPHSVVISTPGISASPLLAECTSQDENQPDLPTSRTNATEQPVDRLIKVVQSLTPEALSSSINDIGYVVSMIDRIAGSAPGNGSRAAAGEDLVAMAKCHLQARNFMSRDGSATRKKLKRRIIALPLYDVFSPESNDDSFKQLHGFESSQLESTATSCVKRHKHEVNEGLLEEIWKINQKLIDTVVDVSENNEGEEGIVVKFTYTAIALSSGLKAQLACTRTSPMMTLRLEVPANYPACSPVLLNKLPGYPSKDLEDLSIKAKSKFRISLRHLAQPMSLGEMAKAWDICAREVILEYAQRTGGGSFSSTHGSWENCIAA